MQAYHGRAEDNGSFSMNYSLEGDPAQLADMVSAVELTPAVQSVASGCGIPEPHELPGGDGCN